MFKIVCVGHRNLRINHNLIIAALCVQAISSVAYADQTVKLHRPSNKERNEVQEIFKIEAYEREYFNSKKDYGFTMADVEVAELNLDNAKKPEIVIRVNNPGFDGSSGYGFDIWKKAGKKWKNIAGDDFGEKHEIIVTDRMVNGFRVFRVPSDPYDRVYNGQSYTCPDCPP